METLGGIGALIYLGQEPFLQGQSDVFGRMSNLRTERPGHLLSTRWGLIWFNFEKLRHVEELKMNWREEN